MTPTRNRRVVSLCRIFGNREIKCAKPLVLAGRFTWFPLPRSVFPTFFFSHEDVRMTPLSHLLKNTFFSHFLLKYLHTPAPPPSKYMYLKEETTPYQLYPPLWLRSPTSTASPWRWKTYTTSCFYPLSSDMYMTLFWMVFNYHKWILQETPLHVYARQPWTNVSV